MKIALLSDIHANRQALAACIAHARAQGAGQFALLGGFRLHPLQRGTTRFTGRQFALQALHLGLH